MANFLRKMPNQEIATTDCQIESELFVIREIYLRQVLFEINSLFSSFTYGPPLMISRNGIQASALHYDFQIRNLLQVQMPMRKNERCTHFTFRHFNIPCSKSLYNIFKCSLSSRQSVNSTYGVNVLVFSFRPIFAWVVLEVIIIPSVLDYYT